MLLKPSFARKLNQDGLTPLHLAMLKPQTKTVDGLLDADSDLVVRVLLDNGAKLDVKNSDGLTAMDIVERESHVTNNEAREHTNQVFDDIDEKPLVDSPLHTAAASGKTHFALELMRLKPSFAKKLNPTGFSPVHLALQEGHTGTVLRLFDADKELIRVQGKGGRTPLHHVAEHENLDQLLDVFLSACPTSTEWRKFLNLMNEDGNTALHINIKEMLTRAGALNAVSVPERLK
ncbi:hypothetical protein TIFTF001_003034 [Ficus carica]|uniref:Uncharacterized protein n=1 Tax=Ficus carica TaxID=3494 RepID=A0AA88CUM4_FICCA|nr:hypothetical protein TIFTF001_003034 [Ficus carica]